ncbi:MAG: hypothetical protein LBQ24_07120 [Candidatus Peribacteria bacterium]|nr:hypothetical protein [Candidatus Peribacteria bacterium]
MEDLKLTFDTLSGTTSSTTANHLFNVVYAKIGNTIMTWTPDASDSNTAKFDGLAMIN